MSSTPKQFIEINNKPIVMYPIATFLDCNIDKVIVTLPSEEWVNWLKEHESFINDERIHLIVGGNTRNDSIIKAINYLETIGINEKDNILTHDAARVLIDKQIIKNHLDALNDNDAVATYIKTSDTIAISNDHKFITSVPNRDNLYWTNDYDW